MRLLRTLAFCLAATLPLPAAFAQTIDYARLDDRISRLAAQEDIVGLAVAVIDHGHIAFANGYGVTERGGTPVTDETVFRWASLSKGVAATEVAILADRHELNLTDTVSKFRTSLRLPGGGEHRATLEDVLSHRLGIVPNAYDTRLEDGWEAADIRHSLRSLKPLCPVGDCHTYQNVAYDTISEVVEDVTHSSYAEAVEESVFKPLGMVSASIGRNGLQTAPSWARPYSRRSRADDTQLKRRVNEDYYRVPAAGGVNGSILDLANYARAQMGLMPDVLSEKALEMLQTPRVYTSGEQRRMSSRYRGTVRDARYGLGWRIYKYGVNGDRVIGHRGAVEGYRSYILFDPEQDTGVVILWNSSSRRPNGIGFEVMDMLYSLPPQDWMEIDTPATGG
ncbi:serine hydrolase domain-containing protein [Hyphomonas jannaschiana]|uniref:serine hydrolase domain-containing protein n=1 Tax=Hyphomonas jannaschiana TaxID=86 RepID=UPI0035C712CF